VASALKSRFLHEQRNLARSKFVQVNCVNINQSLFEATMFGALKGSYTDSKNEVVGLVEQANHGTLFLDEIGEMPLEIQSKFLTFLDTGEYRRLGAKSVSKSECHIVTATNRDLRAEATQGLFRLDLYYRLSAYSVKIPALGDRLADLAHFIHLQTDLKDIFNADIAERWFNYHWTGNFRELDQNVEKFRHSKRDPVIELMKIARSKPAAQLTTLTQDNAKPNAPSLPASDIELSPEALVKTTGLNRAMLGIAYVRAQLDSEKAAEDLGIVRPQFVALLDHFQLKREDLMVQNFRENEELKKEFLDALGAKQAVGQLFGRTNVYNWYKDFPE